MGRRLQLAIWLAVIVVWGGFAVGALSIALSPPANTQPTFTVPVPPNQQVGVIVQDITPQIAAAFSLKERYGAVVTALDAGTLQAGDVILSVNGQSIRSRRNLEMVLAAISPTDALIFQVSRNDGTHEVVIQKSPETTPPSENQPVPNVIAPGFRGVRLDDGSGLPQNVGVIVTDVERGTPADAAGLRQSDIIVDVNQLPVFSVEQFFGYVEKLSGQRVMLGVIRQGIYSVIVVPSLY